MKSQQQIREQKQVWAFILLMTVAMIVFQVFPLIAHAQNLGGAPVFNKSVQGQQATQPEGTLLNLVNFVGNVLCPLGAAIFVVAALISYVQGRGAVRWAVTAVGLLMISGLTRLIEAWVSQAGAVQ